MVPATEDENVYSGVLSLVGVETAVTCSSNDSVLNPLAVFHPPK